jgi:hypothetical protein
MKVFQIISFGTEIFHISINLFSLSFSEIKALQEIEDHENVGIKIEFDIDYFL